MLTWFTCNSIASFHVLMLCRKYKSTLKILLWKKKMGFVKIKKNIFSRTGLTGSLSPQRASRLFALTLSYISVRRCAIPGVSSLAMLTLEELEEAPHGWPDNVAKGDNRDLTANILIQYSTSVYIYICINICTSQRHFILLTVQTLTVFHKDFNN